MNQIEAIYQKDKHAASFVQGYLSYVSDLVRKMDPVGIASFIELLLDTRQKGQRIYFIGNGGSAATASHFANDISIGTRTLAKPFRAMSLTDNLAVITAIANDFGYEEIFVQQLKTCLSKGDVVVGISASGNSENIVRAIDYANGLGAVTVGLTGFDGGKLKQKSQISIHVPTEKGEYGPVEDLHMILDHLLGAYLTLVCREERKEA